MKERKKETAFTQQTRHKAKQNNNKIKVNKWVKQLALGGGETLTM